MAGPLFSTNWYRVAGLTPRLRAQAHIHRHQYRGQTWYVLQDSASSRLHRFSPAAHAVIGLMDGRRTVQATWDLATERLGDHAPTQDEIIQLLGQLHAADVLECDVPPDAAELLRRQEQRTRRVWLQALLNPMAWRIPLLDPEPFLASGLPLVRPLMGWGGALLWVAVVAPAVLLAGAHWTDLTRDVTDRVFAERNLLLLWILFPAIKILHEFGHAFLVKSFGGEVHTMGVMLLVLTPVPYVDASSASAFRSKWQRIAVGAGGMLVELFLAALALFVWLSAQPGTVRTLAFNAVFIAGVSTLLFNANPLLRYDGYYILGDLLEIPNLGTRANAYLGYLGVRYLFGERESEPPEATAGERGWFIVYAIASFAYRVFISVAIVLFIANRFFVVGVLLAAAAVVGWVIVPAGKGVAFLFTSPSLRRVRGRALAVTGLAVAAAAAGLCLMPAPLRTRAEGVVWVPEEALVRASTDGFIERVAVTPGASVRRGDLLVVLRDPELEAQVRVLEARRRELDARYREQQPRDRVKAAIIDEQRRYVAEALDDARRRLADMAVRSRADGRLVIGMTANGPGRSAVVLAEDMEGRFVRKGELLAHVLALPTFTVRAILPQADIDLVRTRTRRVELRLADRIPDVLPATVTRVVPGASDRLPATALGIGGGGDVGVDPADPEGLKATESVFQVDLRLPPEAGALTVGGRVYLRFDHGTESLALQGYRRLRQIFLARFHV